VHSYKLNTTADQIYSLPNLPSTPSSRDTYATRGDDGSTRVNLPPGTDQHGQGQTGHYPTNSYTPQSHPPQPVASQSYDNTTIFSHSHPHVKLNQLPPGYQTYPSSDQRQTVSGSGVNTQGTRRANPHNPITWPPSRPDDLAAIARCVAHRNDSSPGENRRPEDNRRPGDNGGQGDRRGLRNDRDVRNNRDDGGNGTHEAEVAEARRGKKPKGESIPRLRQ